MANSLTHAALPYPIRKARFSLPVAFRLSTGVLTDPTTPDTEKSTDGGATFSDTAEEITTGGANGAGYLTLTGAEMDNDMLWIAAKSANDLTTPVVLIPRVLALVGSGTLSAGSAGGGTLGTLLAYDVTGCFIRTTGGTGGGGTGGANNQARKIATYTPSTGAFTVSPNWETQPDNTTTYDVLLPEGVTLGMLRTLNPTTAGRTLTIESDGMGHADVKEILGQAPTLSSDNRLKVDTVEFNDVPLATTNPLPTVGPDAAGGIRDVHRVEGTLQTAGDLAALHATTQSQITAMRVNTRANLSVPIEIETPDASTQVYKIRLFLFDIDGNMEAPDSTPTIALVNAAGTDRSSRLSAASNPSTGVYSWDYTATAGDAEEQLNWTFTVVEGGLTRTYPATTYIVEETAYRFSSSDRATLQARASQASLDALNNLSQAQAQSAAAAAITAFGPPTNAQMEARTLVAADYGTAANQTTILNRLGAWTGTGLNTLLGAWRALWNKSAGLTPSDLTSGVGASDQGDNTTDSLPALRDAVDAGGGGGGEDCPTAEENAAATAALITQQHGTGSYVGTAGQMSGSTLPTFNAVSLVYLDLSLKTIGVVDAAGDAVELPDPDDETMTLVIETHNRVNVYSRSTDADDDPIEIDPDAGTITFVPTDLLVGTAPLSLILSLRGTGNRLIAEGAGNVRYSPVDEAGESP